MKMQLTQTTKTTDGSKNPSDAFKNCPVCQSKDLISIDDEVLCSKCDWDSCRATVSAGRMDKFFDKAFKQSEPVCPDQIETDRNKVVELTLDENLSA